MSGDTIDGEGAPASVARARTVLATAGFVLCCCVLALALSAAVTAQESDEGTDTPTDSGEPPAFGNATKGNLTTIQLTITDDTDVDEASISAADFDVNPGNLKGISVNESGSDAEVELYLSSIVTSDTVNVSLAGGGSIGDGAGNTLTTGSASVSGMDGFRPQLQDFTVSRINDSAARIRVVSSEPLSELFVGVGGAGTSTLTRANFTEIDTPAGFEIPYETTVTFDQEGEYDVLVGTMTDENGVSSRYNVERTFLVDRTSPTPAISAPASTSVGESVTFSAEGSSDEYGIAGYEWHVNGNATATGDPFEYTFGTPGYHGVTVTVRDRRNNTANRTYPILVESDATTESVSVDVDNATTATATVGPNRSTGRVLIGANGSMVGTNAVRLESLTVDVPVDQRASLAFGASENVSSSFDAVNTTGLAGLTVDHDRSLSTATFRFAVNRSRLADAGPAPDQVTLYRNADGWRSIYTTRIEESDGWVTYEATAAGLSEFVVGAAGGETADDGAGDASSTDGTTDEGTANDLTTTGTPSIRVTNSTLLTPGVEQGERALVRAVARNSGNATGNFVVGVMVNDSVITTTTVTVPADENRTVTFAERVEASGTVVVNGTIAGDLAVAGAGSAATAGGGGGLPIPNPLALWPGGLIGRVLGAVFWLAVIVYAVLKGLAIYLGY